MVERLLNRKEVSLVAKKGSWVKEEVVNCYYLFVYFKMRKT